MHEDVYVIDLFCDVTAFRMQSANVNALRLPDCVVLGGCCIKCCFISPHSVKKRQEQQQEEQHDNSVEVFNLC